MNQYAYLTIQFYYDQILLFQVLKDQYIRQGYDKLFEFYKWSVIENSEVYPIFFVDAAEFWFFSVLVCVHHLVEVLFEEVFT